MRTTIPAEQADQQSGSTPSEIEIRPLMAGEDPTAFRTLNEEWITRYFALEKKDIETLGDPDNAILRAFLIWLYTFEAEPEPGLSVGWGDVGECDGDGLIKGVDGPCLCLTEDLL